MISYAPRGSAVLVAIGALHDVAANSTQALQNTVNANVVNILPALQVFDNRAIGNVLA